MKHLHSAVLLFSFTISAFGQATPSLADWQHDLDEIVRDIRVYHPDPFTKTGRLTFLREAAALKAALPSLTEEQRVVRAMRLVALVGDGHTQLGPDNPRFAYWYPIKIYEFTDGYFVTSAHKSVADLAGAQVLEVAGRPVADVMTEVRRLHGADNALDTKNRIFAFHNASLMRGLGYAGASGELPVKFKLRSGKIVDRTLTPSRTASERYKADDSTFEWQFRAEVYGLPFGTDDDWIAAYKDLSAQAFRKADNSRPPHLTLRRGYVSRPLPESQAYYAQINQVDDTSFGPFIRDVLREVEQQKPRRFILDLRYNFGGDGSTVTPMIHEFIKLEANRPWKEFYILTGRKTFSAGIMALDALMRNTEHTIVGEPAGAALNSYGDATERTYLRTGLHMYVSTLRHELSDSNDLSEFIKVDVPAPFAFADYVAGRDPAVDPILRGDEMRSLAVIALADGGAAARRAYLDRKARFGKYTWWTPPSEIELRNACDALLEQKRNQDALETCKLNTEIHPEIWNTWLNLGTTERKLGMKQESYANFRCVLQIDPNNFNGSELRKILAEAPAGDSSVASGCGVLGN